VDVKVKRSGGEIEWNRGRIKAVSISKMPKRMEIASCTALGVGVAGETTSTTKSNHANKMMKATSLPARLCMQRF